MSKNDLDNKLILFNRKIISSKTKYLEVQKKLNSLTTRHIFFLARIFFTSNDGSENTFVYKPPTLDMLELKKDKGIDYLPSWKSKGVFNSKLKPLYSAFLHSIKPSGYNMGIKFDKNPLAVKKTIT